MDITKRMKYPEGLKDFIYESTDYTLRSTEKAARYVIYVEPFEGLPLMRVFAFRSKDKRHLTKENLQIEEVARFRDGKNYYRNVGCYYLGGKWIAWGNKGMRFEKWKNKWDFYPRYWMQTKEQIYENLGISHFDYDGQLGEAFFLLLTIYMQNPKVEYLMKAGYGRWAKYLRYMDTSKKSVHEVFKIPQSAVPLLKDPGFGYNEWMYVRKSGCTDPDVIFAHTRIVDKLRDISRFDQIRFGQSDDRREWIKSVLNDDRTARYLGRRIMTHDYVDYLNELWTLGDADRKNLYPKDFFIAHADTTARVHAEELEQYRRGISEMYKKHEKYILDDADFIIRPVSKPEELIMESNVLGHCVKNYQQSVSEGRTEIMFVRKHENPDLPLFTLELKNRKIIQFRAAHNADPSPEAFQFVTGWASKFKLDYPQYFDSIAEGKEKPQEGYRWY